MSKAIDHKSRAHALLSPSSSKRWIACPPSARAADAYENTSSSAAALGTYVHELCEYKVRQRLLPKSLVGKSADLEKLRESPLHSDEAERNSTDYADYCEAIYEELHGREGFAPIALVEQKLDLTEWVEDCFGSNDFACVGSGTLHVVDYKNGIGVSVSASDNTQMMMYALGAYTALSMMYEIERVRMTVYQPRIDNISTWEISATELLEWAEDTLRPRAALAYAGNGERVAGDHCTFCPDAARCSALAEAAKRVAVEDFTPKEIEGQLTDEQIIEMRNAIPLLQLYAKAVESYMHAQALAGKNWEGFKLVESRTTRKWKDEAEAVCALKNAGFKSDQILSTKIKGIGDIEKVVGKKALADMALLHKPAGVATLVPDTDKRQPISTGDAAINEFK